MALILVHQITVHTRPKTSEHARRVASFLSISTVAEQPASNKKNYCSPETSEYGANVATDLDFHLFHQACSLSPAQQDGEVQGYQAENVAGSEDEVEAPDNLAPHRLANIKSATRVRSQQMQAQGESSHICLCGVHDAMIELDDKPRVPMHESGDDT